ncbi:MAG: glycosyltransferase family 2 protein [Candidatus Marsarchaeota archaeon]|nr:glycosyltransferase family 2 protein [Candidatus Marsarchaeota archaeon]MCL5115088.1 glycosyltransferase family 2 protein [Candidatus Marsarchaeota archaeon]
MVNPYISVVIPNMGESSNIGRLLQEIKDVLEGYNYEIIVVDGSSLGPSKNGTARIAKRCGARVLTDFVGKGSALIKGFNAARGKIIISMDADLSNRPKELKLLISGIEIGYDVCVGSRFLSGGGSTNMPQARLIGNTFFVQLMNLIYASRYTDLSYGYRSFSRKALHKLHLTEKGRGIETEILIKAHKAKLNVLEVPSFEKKRNYEKNTRYNLQEGWIIFKTILKNV